jgi:hypothetical protein
VPQPHSYFLLDGRRGVEPERPLDHLGSGRLSLLCSGGGFSLLCSGGGLSLLCSGGGLSLLCSGGGLSLLSSHRLGKLSSGQLARGGLGGGRCLDLLAHHDLREHNLLLLRLLREPLIDGESTL